MMLKRRYFTILTSLQRSKYVILTSCAAWNVYVIVMKADNHARGEKLLTSISKGRHLNENFSVKRSRELIIGKLKPSLD